MKKRTIRLKACPKRNDQFVAVALAIVTVCTLAGSDVYLGAPDSPHLAHANTSANPYQPVNGSYVPAFDGMPSYNSESRRGSGTSSVSPVRRAFLERRLKALHRSADAILKQIVRAEDAADGLQTRIDAAPGRRNDDLEDLVLTITDNITRLEKRLAAVNSQIASFELQLDPSSDQSR